MKTEELTIPQTLGHYHLIEQIGTGGRGIVFRAYDLSHNREVAVKVLTQHVGSIPEQPRLSVEALVVGRLSHPNIALALDFGQEYGIEYLVTEYVPGFGLDEKLENGPLPQEVVLDLGIQLVDGLMAAHRHNVVHCDLKPSNIRVTPSGQLKILDFGLARFAEAVDEKTETEDVGSLLSIHGTLPYMAPEALRGEPVDDRADIWAAGAVLYEMVTGQRAFPHALPPVVIDAILHRDPVRPALLNPEATVGLEAVILRALDRDRNRRYQSGEEFRADLMRLKAGNEPAPRLLQENSIPPVASERRMAYFVYSSVLVLLAVLAIVSTATLAHWRAPRHMTLAVMPIDTAEQDSATTALGWGLMATLTASLADASKRDPIQLISPRELRDRNVGTVQEARREFGCDLVLKGTLQKEGGTIRLSTYLVNANTGKQLAARTAIVAEGDSFALQSMLLSDALEMLPVKVDSDNRRRLTVHPDTKPEAYAAYIRGRGYLLEFNKPEDIDHAIGELTRAVAIDPNYALGYAELGRAYWAGFQNFYRQNEWIVKASGYCNKALSLNPELVEGYICLGNVLNGTGRSENAILEFQRALNSEPGSALALRGLADAYAAVGNIGAAEEAYKRAVALRPDDWAVYNWLGAFYCDQNRYAECAEMLSKVTQLAPNSYLGFVNLGGAYLLQGRYADAISASKQSITIRPTAMAYSNIGYTYTLLHRFPEAIDALYTALKLDDSDWMTWGNFADALYWSPDKRGDAISNYKKALASASSKLQINAEDPVTLAYIATYSAMIGEEASALQHVERALKLAPGNGEVLFRAAMVYQHLMQYDKARTYLDRAVQAGYSQAVIRDTPDFWSNDRVPTDSK